MKKTGTLKLTTNDTTRSVSYVIIDEKIIITTNPLSRKVGFIQQNNCVTIDLDKNKYIARIIQDCPEAVELKQKFRSELNPISRIINGFMGKKNTTIIELTKI